MKKLLIACASLVLLAACSVPRPQPTPTPTQVPTLAPDLAVRYHFVTNTLTVPTTQAQAEALALNVDGDPQGHPDNKLGDLFSMLVSASPGLEFQPMVDDVLKNGEIVTLHLLETNDLVNAPSASWSVFVGQTS